MKVRITREPQTKTMTIEDAVKGRHFGYESGIFRWMLAYLGGDLYRWVCSADSNAVDSSSKTVAIQAAADQDGLHVFANGAEVYQWMLEGQN